MTIIKGAAAEQFLNRPQSQICAALIYGPDHGRISESGLKLVTALQKNQDDPFALTELDPQIIGKEENRLLEELLAIPFMGGKRIVRLRGTDKKTESVLCRILGDERIRQSFLVVEAGQLTRRSALRRLFEKEPFLAALAFFEDDSRSLGQVLDEELHRAGVTIDPQARALLLEQLGSDRRLSRNEIQKLCLYTTGKSRIETADVEAIVGDISIMAIDNVIADAGSANLSELEHNLHKCFHSTVSPAAILSTALTHFSRLHALSARLGSGRDASGLLTALRPRLHFRKEVVMKNHLRLWHEPAIRKALSILSEAEKNTRFQAALAETITRRALMQIALMARARRR
jgi:DNA polymerase-3 subunit delta